MDTNMILLPSVFMVYCWQPRQRVFGMWLDVYKLLDKHKEAKTKDEKGI